MEVEVEFPFITEALHYITQHIYEMKWVEGEAGREKKTELEVERGEGNDLRDDVTVRGSKGNQQIRKYCVEAKQAEKGHLSLALNLFGPS
jgi:hypothetical protein